MVFMNKRQVHSFNVPYGFPISHNFNYSCPSFGMKPSVQEISQKVKWNGSCK